MMPYLDTWDLFPPDSYYCFYIYGLHLEGLSRIPQCAPTCWEHLPFLYLASSYLSFKTLLTGHAVHTACLCDSRYHTAL